MWGSPPVSSSVSASVRSLLKTKFSRVFLAGGGRLCQLGPLLDDSAAWRECARKELSRKVGPPAISKRGTATGSESMKHFESGLSSQGINSAKAFPCQSLVVVTSETLATRGVLQIIALSQIAGPSLIVH